VSIKRLSVLLAILAMVICVGCGGVEPGHLPDPVRDFRIRSVPAAGAAGDLGAQIASADAELGAGAGEIQVTASGIISEGEVSLSAGHNLVCSTNQITIFLNAGSYLYQNSHTSIKNCVISSTSVPIRGEIQSVNTSYLRLENVSFVGGGNLVYWNGVSQFTALDNIVVSITAVQPATKIIQSGFYIVNSSFGEVNNLRASGFVFPVTPTPYGILGLDLSNNVKVNNISIKNVDASYVNGGVGGITIGGSREITINGGVITGNPNMDGILSLSYEQTPSYGITITGVNSSYNGGVGGNPHAHSLGDGIDLINTGRVYISDCILRGSGNPADKQPAIWVFIDDDVVVANSDLSDGSAAGIALAGSRDVHLIHDSINRNQGSGVYVEWQAGTATNVGSVVSVVTGVSGGFGLAWVPGTPFVLDGITYKIASVTDSGHLTLADVPPDHSTPVGWAVNSSLEIRDVVIEDNGLSEFGGQNQDGISWADDTQGLISGVTATDTGAGTQLYGLQLAQTATAYLYGDDFLGNIGNSIGIYAQSESHMYTFPSPLDPPNECTDAGVPKHGVIPPSSCVVYCATVSSLPEITFAPCRVGLGAEPSPY
jgi:hypothetical protein